MKHLKQVVSQKFMINGLRASVKAATQEVVEQTGKNLDLTLVADPAQFMQLSDELPEHDGEVKHGVEEH